MLKVLEKTVIAEINSLNINIISKIKSFSTIELSNGIVTKYKQKKTFIDVDNLYESTIQNFQLAL